MLIALHNLATQHLNLVTSIRIARETGYTGIEIGGPKLKSYLAAGYTLESLLPLGREAQDHAPHEGHHGGAHDGQPGAA